MKRSNHFFTMKVFYYRCLRYSNFKFFNNKNFFMWFDSVTFCKNVFILWYSNMITNLKFRIFFTVLYTKIDVCAWLYINNRLHFNGFMYALLYSLTMSANSSFISLFFSKFGRKFNPLPLFPPVERDGVNWGGPESK